MQNNDHAAAEVTEPNDKPLRMFLFLQGLTALSHEHGIIIGGLPELEFRDAPIGNYCLNPNNDGPEFGWVAQ